LLFIFGDARYKKRREKPLFANHCDKEKKVHFCSKIKDLTDLKTLLYILIAAAITLAAIVYQRTTGPTYPKKAELQLDGKSYLFKLTRSHGGETACPLEFNIPDTAVTGTVTFRKFPSREAWTTLQMVREDTVLKANLPHQPPAGKLEYKVEFQKDGVSYPLHETHATVVRFKGDVPVWILLPHIILMFVAMFFANLSGVMALFRHPKFRFFTWWTLILLGLGGMILGPWVQYHAFGEAWAGIPFAWDLTDNKTLFAFLFWILAVVMNRKKERPGYVILASLVMLAVYSIPHSMFGSQLDPDTGKIIQGAILQGTCLL